MSMLAVVLAATLAASGGTVSHVSTAGNDATADGSKARPYASISAAVAKAKGQRGSRVLLAPGVYRLGATLRLGPENSGLTIESEVPGAAVVSGGRVVSGWEKVDDNVYAAAVPWVTTREKGFRRLIVNGKSCPRAKLPKQGYFKAQKDDLPDRLQHKKRALQHPLRQGGAGEEQHHAGGLVKQRGKGRDRVIALSGR